MLFSGTPCQINGLLAALGNTKSDKLLTVDFVCHGVPSPGVFASYLVELEKKHGSRVSAYTFRDKRLGWKNFSAVATFENGEEHAGTQTTEPYLYGFLQNLYLRPSCHSCSQLRGERHAADITLADFCLLYTSDTLFSAMYLMHVHTLAALTKPYVNYLQRGDSLMGMIKPNLCRRLITLSVRLTDYVKACGRDKELADVLPVLCYDKLICKGIRLDPSLEDVYAAMTQMGQNATCLLYTSRCV